MTLTEFRKLTENMDGELELKIYDTEYAVYYDVSEIEHTNKKNKIQDELENKFFLGIE